MKCTFKLIFLLGVLPLVFTREIKFFRKDYTFVEEFNAYYKENSQPLTWENAFIACDDEGSILFYPTNKREMALVRNLTTNIMVIPPNVTDIFIGVHDKYNMGNFITVDGHPAPSLINIKTSYDSSSSEHYVLMNVETGLFKISSSSTIPYPFICKKEDNAFCPTIDPGYKYVKSLNKCYKVNNRERNWSSAMQTCNMEGGILTVIQNEGEAVDIYNNLSLKSQTKYHVGIRKIYHNIGDFYTVKGQKIDEVYQRPYEGTDGDYCGAIYVSDSKIYTTTTKCGQRPFICEMEVDMYKKKN